LFKIAEGIQTGTVKHLEKLATITQLEELENILNVTKWRYIQDKKINSEKFVFTPEVIDYTEYPHPVLYKDHIFSTLNKLQHDKGKKLAAARMLKRLNAARGKDFLTITEGQPLEDFKTLFLWTSPGIDKWEVERYKTQNLRLERVKRLGITTLPELRAALRELVKIKEGVQLTDEQNKMQQIRELERQFVGKKIDGFFPTPPGLATEIVRKASIVDGDIILEPSAGLGHIAEAITDAHPCNHLFCIEMYLPLVKALELKGFDAIAANFLHCTEKSNLGQYLPKGLNFTGFDKIIMNPPFENLQDIDHVNHAWQLLKPGGRIVAIMAGNKSRETAKVKDFMQFVDQYGIWEENPTGSFASAFRPTGVNTITVILDKPKN